MISAEQLSYPIGNSSGHGRSPDKQQQWSELRIHFVPKYGHFDRWSAHNSNNWKCSRLGCFHVESKTFDK